jgi:hypothetical protein
MKSSETRQISLEEIAELLALSEAPQGHSSATRRGGVRMPGLSYTLSHSAYERLVRAGQARLEDA